MITAFAGFRVGHWTGANTGVTVVLAPPGTVGAGEVRGGAPATREVALLDPLRTVTRVDAVVFAGGSAFGLAAADGVVGFLAERGRGFPTAGGPVPIVPAAAVFDLTRLAPGERPPGPEEGRAAAHAALRATVFERGRVGAGRGATVGKWRGVEHAAPGGVGTASSRVEAVTLAAVAVVNAVGDVLGDDGRVLAGSGAPPGRPAFPEAEPFSERVEGAAAGEHTTLVALLTDAALDKVACALLAQAAHDGLARALHPAHTRVDGDLAIVLGAGVVPAHLDRLGVAATDVTAAAVRDAVRP